jgi:glycosyltransferase involved in cell wall biosynthesis
MSLPLSVSLIATVRNERLHLAPWLAAIESQSRMPDEIVIVDGGSTDGTWEQLSRWTPDCALQVIRAPGASISTGRNIAMSRTSGDVIAVTDCGTVAEDSWLEMLLAPFDDPRVDVSSGFFTPGLGSAWDRSLAAATLPDADEIQPERFLPSSRSVAVRSTWFRRGYEYPEWLDYGEDLIWDLQIRNAGAVFSFVPEAKVSFFVRPDWPAFWRQYYRYARGDGKAGLFGRRHLIRYLTYVIALAMLRRGRVPELCLASLLGAVYTLRPAKRLIRRDWARNHSLEHTAGALVLVPLHMVVGDSAKMAGYPAGLLWRKRRFGSLLPWKNWTRISPDGEMWDPAAPVSRTLPPKD